MNPPRLPLAPPAWLLALVEQNDIRGIRWHSVEQIRTASVPLPNAADLLLPSEAGHRTADEALLARMVSVADGPERQDRAQRPLKARLFLDRENPNRLLLALAANHPPTLWVPAGQTRQSVTAVLSAYCPAGLPPQETLPFQKRLFLTTTAMLKNDFRAIESLLARSAFTDSLLWGTSQATDPFGDSVALDSLAPAELRRYRAQARGVFPRTSVRTRFSRSIIQAIDFNNAYFADLYFQPAPPEFAAEYAARYGSDFPPGTPADILATLSGHGLLCLDTASMRKHRDAATSPNQREGLGTIVDFMERAPGEPEDGAAGYTGTQEELPGWLQAMIDTQAGASEGVRWLTPDERAAAADERKPFAQSREPMLMAGSLRMTDEQLEAAEEGWRNKLLVGEGPLTYFDHAGGYRLQFWLDTQQPDTLWAGMPSQPPFLWFPVGRDAATMASALRPYLPTDLARPRPHVGMAALALHARQAAQGPIPGAAEGQDREVRLMVGIALAQLDLSLSQVENYLLQTRVADPCFLMQGTAQDNPRSNPTVTVVRTLYSRSTVQLDWYDSLSGTLFAEISYAPAGQAETIQAFNERFGLSFPLDIPVDVPALLLGLEAIRVPALQAHMTRRWDEPDKLQFYLYCLAILSSPDIAEPLRPYAAHPSPLVRGAVIDLAAQKAPDLLRELQGSETDPDLRARIDAALSS